MKKIIYSLISLLLCITLCSCDPGIYVISDESLQGINNVELIEYDNPEQKHFNTWVSDQFDKLKSFKLDRYVVLETLPSDDIDEFLGSFKETDILHTYYAYDSPKDICIKLSYDNGNFLIIWANYKEGSYAGYIGEYLHDGSVLSFWGSFSSITYYEELVGNYFSTELN